MKNYKDEDEIDQKRIAEISKTDECGEEEEKNYDLSQLVEMCVKSNQPSKIYNILEQIIPFVDNKNAVKFLTNENNQIVFSNYLLEMLFSEDLSDELVKISLNLLSILCEFRTKEPFIDFPTAYHLFEKYALNKGVEHNTSMKFFIENNIEIAFELMRFIASYNIGQYHRIQTERGKVDYIDFGTFRNFAKLCIETKQEDLCNQGFRFLNKCVIEKPPTDMVSIVKIAFERVLSYTDVDFEEACKTIATFGIFVVCNKVRVLPPDWCNVYSSLISQMEEEEYYDRISIFLNALSEIIDMEVAREIIDFEFLQFLIEIVDSATNNVKLSATKIIHDVFDILPQDNVEDFFLKLGSLDLFLPFLDKDNIEAADVILDLFVFVIQKAQIQNGESNPLFELFNESKEVMDAIYEIREELDDESTTYERCSLIITEMEGNIARLEGE